MIAARGGALLAAALVGAAFFVTAPAAQTPAAERFAMRVVTQGLDAPWEITWGPDGQLWITERRGRRVLRVNPADGAQTVALTLPDVHQSVTQDGLLGLALHPGLLRGTAIGSPTTRATVVNGFGICVRSQLCTLQCAAASR